MWDEYVSKWWLIVLRGLLAVGVGLFLIASPIKSLIVITTLVGFYFLMEGVMVTIMSLTNLIGDDDWWVFIFQGLISLLIGLLIFSLPQLTLAAHIFLVAVWIFVEGIGMLFQAFYERRHIFTGKSFLTGGAVVMLLISFILFSNPKLSLALTAILMGGVVLMSGIFTASLGFQVKEFNPKSKRSLK